jgi:hypothetical protein
MNRYYKLIQQIEMQSILGAKEQHRHIARLEHESKISKLLRKSTIMQ